MNALLKCRMQNIIILFAFFAGCLFAITFVPIDNNCNKNRDTEKFNFRKIEPGAYDLIILIISSPKNGDRRQAIRETWLQLSDRINKSSSFKYKYYFIVGSFKLEADTILHLGTEQSLYNDLLFLNVFDDYTTLTYKVLKSFVWLDEQRTNKNFNYNFVLKCDDDTFVRFDELANEIIQLRNTYQYEFNTEIDKYEFHSAEIDKTYDSLVQNHLYWGYFNGNARVKQLGKWKEQNWILCDHYLPYALGGGYILSKSLVGYIAKNAKDFSLYNSEDVSVGVWLAAVKNINRKHDIRFDTEWTSRGCNNSNLLVHKQSIQDLKSAFNNIKTFGQPCELEYTKRNSYEYNWNVLPSKCCKKNINT